MRQVVLFFLVVIAMALSGCSQYDNDAMAGDAVDIPDQTPLSKEPSMLTAPSPSPSPASVEPNGQQMPGR
jgi:hypothetical protein